MLHWFLEQIFMAGAKHGHAPHNNLAIVALGSLLNPSFLQSWIEPPHLRLKGVNNKPYTGSQREEKTNKSLS